LRRWGRTGAVAAVLLAGGLAAGEPTAGPEEILVLAAGGYWRQHVTCLPPRVSVASARAAGMQLDQAGRRLKPRGRGGGAFVAPSPPPEEGWAAAGFDDRHWDRVRGAFTPARQEIALLCRRGKFVVRDPAAVHRLTLEITYVGGAVVYLNGRAVARAHLPAGTLRPDTPAEDYPEAAFIVSDGPRKGRLLHHYYDRQRTEQFALRQRRLGRVALPGSRGCSCGPRGPPAPSAAACAVPAGCGCGTPTSRRRSTS
jgi:hypothetical protein